MSVRDEDKEEAVEIGKRFEALGYRIYATRNTAKTLQEAGEKQSVPISSNSRHQT